MSRTIKLNATGEELTFVKGAEDTNGEYVEMLTYLPANSTGPPKHIHVFQSELFEALEGTLGLHKGEEIVELKPGESFEVPANVPHSFYSVNGEELKFRVVFRPALNIEYILTETFESCNRQNSKDPSAFDACFALQQAKGEYLLHDVPVLIQKTIFPLTAWVGKLFGLIKAKPLK